LQEKKHNRANEGVRRPAYEVLKAPVALAVAVSFSVRAAGQFPRQTSHLQTCRADLGFGSLK
jgi:hypothetical protein